MASLTCISIILLMHLVIDWLDWPVFNLFHQIFKDMRFKVTIYFFLFLSVNMNIIGIETFFLKKVQELQPFSNASSNVFYQVSILDKLIFKVIV